MGLSIADCETGNPPEGWESEGQFKSKESGDSSQELVEKKYSFFDFLFWILAPDYWIGDVGCENSGIQKFGDFTYLDSL